MEIIETIRLPMQCYTTREGKIRALTKPTAVVGHHTSGRWAFKNDPYNIDRIVNEILIKYKLSYHYLIDRVGSIYKLLPNDVQAWHAGASRLDGVDWCNNFALGICLISTGYHSNKFGEAYPAVQLDAFAWLLNELGMLDRFRIVGHRQVRENWLLQYPGRLINGKRPKAKYDLSNLMSWNYVYDQISDHNAGVII